MNRETFSRRFLENMDNYLMDFYAEESKIQKLEQFFQPLSIKISYTRDYYTTGLPSSPLYPIRIYHQTR